MSPSDDLPHITWQEAFPMADQVREHRSLLAAAEKRLLVRMASCMPASIHSDHLTALALAAMGLAGVGFWLARWDRTWLWVVVGALVLNWFGDSLDGTLARVRRVERPRYGFYVDHVIDIIGITFLLTGLACSGFMTPVIALALLVAYLLVSGEVFLATAVQNVFRMSFAGIGPTELRIILSVGAIALRNDPHLNLGALGRVPLFDVGGVVATAGLIVALAVAIARNTRALARLEPRPRVDGPRPRAADGPGPPSGALRKSGHGSTIPLLRVQGNSRPWGCLTLPSRRRSEARSSYVARGHTTSRTSM